MRTQASNGNADTGALRDAHQATVAELNRVVAQAESLLAALGNEGSEAVTALRDRVQRTIHDARSKVVAGSDQARTAAVDAAHRADAYVRENPWRGVMIGLAIGAAAAFSLASYAKRRE